MHQMLKLVALVNGAVAHGVSFVTSLVPRSSEYLLAASMPLTVGARLGHYAVNTKIGEGGRTMSRVVRQRAFILAVLAVGPAMTASLSATNLPPGFVEELVIGGLPGPMSMAWGPDGELWLGSQQGHVWVLRGKELIEVARLAVSDNGERGVHGIAVDPDFEHNRHVWIYYSSDGPPFRNRLVRFQNLEDQLVDETLILETPDLLGNAHNGGCIRFGADETIFLSTGDDSQPDISQNPDDIRGKILHINRDGSPAKGNPYLDGRGDPRVWAIGFRNPWRFSLQPESDNLVIGDVGASSYEELDIGVPGGNFGWPRVEGPEPSGVPGMSYPMYSYPHTSELGHAIIAGEHANARNFPPEYEGDFFFADAITREVFRMVLDESNQPISVRVFASDTAQPVDIQFGPDGALYYLSFDGGQLFRISFAGGSNRQPVATTTATPDSGESPLTVTFDASASFDPDGNLLTFGWDFGDGTRGNGPVVTKQYPAGTYKASLTVTDLGGGESIVHDIRIVSGNTRPNPALNFPPDGQLYTEGEVIQFAGVAFDREEWLVPCQRFEWAVIFHHKGHSHPFLGPLQGSCRGSFVIDSHGEEQTFYEIRLIVQDKGIPLGDEGKLMGTRSVALFPRDGSQR